MVSMHLHPFRTSHILIQCLQTARCVPDRDHRQGGYNPSLKNDKILQILPPELTWLKGADVVVAPIARTGSARARFIIPGFIILFHPSLPFHPSIGQLAPRAKVVGLLSKRISSLTLNAPQLCPLHPCQARTAPHLLFASSKPRT